MCWWWFFKIHILKYLGEYVNATACKSCVSLGGYYENCTKCTYGTPVVCTECATNYFLRNSEEGCIRDC